MGGAGTAPATDGGTGERLDGATARRLTIGQVALVVAFTLSLLSININGVVLSRHEVLAAQPAREMLSDGHWIVPTFAGVERVNKPPTMGWLIAASMSIFNSRDEWVARLPAMLSAAMCAVLSGSIAAMAVGRTGGLIASLCTATSYFVLMQGRLAEADMPMAACVCAAMLVFARRVYGAGTGVSAGVLFHLLIAMSFLFKGVGPAFVLPACLLFAILRRDWRTLRWLLHPAGLCVLLLVAASWPVAAWWTYPPIAEAWNRELFQRVSGELSEQIGRVDAWYAYFGFVPLLLLPWFPLTVVGAIAGVRRGAHRTPIGQLLLLWFGVGFALLSCVAWRNKHYAIPIVPACAAATAAGFVVWVRHSVARPSSEGRVVQVIFGLACLIGAATLWFLGNQPERPWLAAAVCVLGLGGAIVIECFVRCRAKAAVVGAFVTAWMIIALAFWKVVPLHDGYRPSAELAGRVNGLLAADEPVALIGLGENHVVYYLYRPMRRIDRLAGESIKPRPTWALAPASAAPSLLAAFGGIEVVDQIPVTSRRQRAEDRLTLFRVRPAPTTAPQ